MNYRRFYSYCLGEVLPKEIHVHHLDGNRGNNHLSNLVAIQAKLHQQYHFYENMLCDIESKYFKSRHEIDTMDIDCRFNFYALADESYLNWFDGNEQDFVKRSNEECIKMRFVEDAKPVLETLNGIIVQIAAVKVMQQIKIQILFEDPFANLSKIPLSKKEQGFINSYFYTANLPF